MLKFTIIKNKFTFLTKKSSSGNAIFAQIRHAMSANIAQSKLIQLLNRFTPIEMKRFGLFAKSEYAGGNSATARAVDGLAKHYPDFSQCTTAALTGSQKPQEPKHVNYLMNELLQLAYRFMAIEALAKQPTQEACLTLKALSERGLEKHYNLLYHRTLERLNADSLLDAQHFQLLYQLEDLNREHIDKKGLRVLNESMQTAVDYLDHFYLIEKLKYTCAMLNSQQVIAAPFAFRYLAELRAYFEHNPLPQSPGIAIYYRIFCMLTKQESETDFAELKQLIQHYGAVFSHAEMTNIYGYALNYCIGKIRQVKEAYVQEALFLYRQGMETGALLEQGKLSPWHFKNIIKLALRSKEYAWTEQFILEKHLILEQSFRQDALHYNLAELYFYTSDYDKALQHLNKVEFTDINYNLGAKVMLVKIYQELGEVDALESLLHAFRVFLQRNKRVSEAVRRAYLNFVRLAAKVVRVPKSKVAALQQEITQMEPLTEKDWLLAQLVQ